MNAKTFRLKLRFNMDYLDYVEEDGNGALVICGAAVEKFLKVKTMPDRILLTISPKRNQRRKQWQASLIAYSDDVDNHVDCPDFCKTVPQYVYGKFRWSLRHHGYRIGDVFYVNITRRKV